MNENEKQVLLAKTLEDMIENNKTDWARAWIVLEHQKTLAEQSKEEVAKAELLMKDSEGRIEFLASLMDKVAHQ